mgnify:CR=1 FL=1
MTGRGGADCVPTLCASYEQLDTARRARGRYLRVSTMGSDNPKGAVAPLRAAARYGRYAAIISVCLVLMVTLFTHPHIDPKSVPVAVTPRRAGATGEGRQGTLASMQGVKNAVSGLKTKLQDVAAEYPKLGDVGALHETTMPRKKKGVMSHNARVLERAEVGRMGKVLDDEETVEEKADEVIMDDETKDDQTIEDETLDDETLEDSQFDAENDDEESDELEESTNDDDEETETSEEAEEASDDDDDDDDDTTDDPKPEGLYTLSALDMDSAEVDLSYAAGKVTLVTNVASE